MEFRLVKKEEIDQVKDLWAYCFEKKDDPFFAWYFEEYCQPQSVLGAFFGAELAGMVHLNSYQLALNEKVLPTSYLVGVATAPQYRGRGVMKNLLKEAFALLKTRGQSVAVLMPVLAGLYLPYGFSYCYQKLKYHYPLRELLNIFKAEPSYQLEFAELRPQEDLQVLYEEYTQKANGYFQRGVREWQTILAELSLSGGRLVFIKKAAEYLGYMLYFVKEDSFRIVELVTLDGKAEEALLNFAGQHFSQADKLVWLAPSNNKAYLKFWQNQDYPSIQPFMMGRIIDPVQAVRDLAFAAPKGFQLKFALTDPVQEENNGRYQLAEKNGILELKQIGEQAELALSIGTFAQLCFGAFKVADLAEAGYLAGASKEQINSLEEIFPVKNNYINEYF